MPYDALCFLPPPNALSFVRAVREVARTARQGAQGRYSYFVLASCCAQNLFLLLI